jgi:hypothetical protein
MQIVWSLNSPGARLRSRAVSNKILGAQSRRTWSAGVQNCLKILRCACSSAPWKSWKGWGARCVRSSNEWTDWGILPIHRSYIWIYSAPWHCILGQVLYVKTYSNAFCVCWCYVIRWIWCLWCYSECASTPGNLKSLPDHGGNQTRDALPTELRGLISQRSRVRFPPWPGKLFSLPGLDARAK